MEPKYKCGYEGADGRVYEDAEDAKLSLQLIDARTNLESAKTYMQRKLKEYERWVIYGLNRTANNNAGFNSWGMASTQAMLRYIASCPEWLLMAARDLGSQQQRINDLTKEYEKLQELANKKRIESQKLSIPKTQYIKPTVMRRIKKFFNI